MGMHILLIEARDRIGGRTWTAKVCGDEFGMGGTWVHWNQPHVFSELYRYGLRQCLKPSAGTTSPQKRYYKSIQGPLKEVSVEEVNSTAEMLAYKIGI